VQFTDTATGGSIGLAMINIIGFNISLSRLITSWTGLETSLGAAARLRDFLQVTPQEDQTHETARPPLTWPSEGSMIVQDLTATYRYAHNFVERIKILL